MEQYQRDQLQLQQYYQQQRIMELQAAQQRQREMEAQNVTRFTQMRERAYATAIAPIGGSVASEMGFMGRNVGLANSAGVARQSLYGTAVDAFLPGSSLFFRTAGFQFNLSQQAVQDRARQQLQAFGDNLPGVMATAALPMPVQRALGIVGMGSVQERAAGLSDTFAGLRGEFANPMTGRGIGVRQANEITRNVTRRLNLDFNGMLDEEQISQLQTAAQSSLTSREIARTGGRPGAVEDLLTQTVKELQGIARNTGVSVESLNQIVMDNKSMGNDFNDLKVAAGAIGTSTTTTTRNREQQLRTALGMTAQGRQMNVANATQFGLSQLESMNQLVDAFNTGSVTRAELFRYGGDGEFDAASRVVNRRMQAGQSFAQQAMGTVGVLGAGALSSLEGGLVNFAGDVAARYLDTPFAAQRAATSFEQQQRFLTQGGLLAREQARAVVAKMPFADEEDRRALEAMEFGRLMGRDPLDARRELDTMAAQEKAIRRKVGGFLDFASGTMPRGAEEVIKSAQKLYAELSPQGFSMDQVLTDETLRQLGFGDLKAVDVANRMINQDSAAQTKRRRMIEEDPELMKMLGIDASANEMYHVHNRIRDRFTGERFGKTIGELGLTDDDMAKAIYEQDMTDKVKHFESLEDVRQMLSSEDGRSRIMSTMSPDAQRAMTERAMDFFLTQQHKINLDNVERGTAKNVPMYVEVVKTAAQED